MTCEFVWRRSGVQLVGWLKVRQPEGRKYGLGIHTGMAGGNRDVKFLADAEWVFGPDELWLCDINQMAVQIFTGRADQAHDRGVTVEVTTTVDRKRELMRRRAVLPARAGAGWRERLRLGLREPGVMRTIASAQADTTAEDVAICSGGVEAYCSRAARLPTSPVSDANAGT